MRCEKSFQLNVWPWSGLDFPSLYISITVCFLASQKNTNINLLTHMPFLILFHIDILHSFVSTFLITTGLVAWLKPFLSCMCVCVLCSQCTCIWLTVFSQLLSISVSHIPSVWHFWQTYNIRGLFITLGILSSTTKTTTELYLLQWVWKVSWNKASWMFMNFDAHSHKHTGDVTINNHT